MNLTTLSELLESLRDSILNPTPIMRAMHVAALVVLLCWLVTL